MALVRSGSIIFSEKLRAKRRLSDRPVSSREFRLEDNPFALTFCSFAFVRLKLERRSKSKSSVERRII
jgi:hypothetical protein